MPYIGPDGNVTDRRSRFRISIITDVFFGVIDAVLIFFRTVTEPPSMIANVSTFLSQFFLIVHTICMILILITLQYYNYACT